VCACACLCVLVGVFTVWVLVCVSMCGMCVIEGWGGRWHVVIHKHGEMACLCRVLACLCRVLACL